MTNQQWQLFLAMTLTELQLTEAETVAALWGHNIDRHSCTVLEALRAVEHTTGRQMNYQKLLMRALFGNEEPVT